jgi:hypothetical protein
MPCLDRERSVQREPGIPDAAALIESKEKIQAKFKAIKKDLDGQKQAIEN